MHCLDAAKHMTSAMTRQVVATPFGNIPSDTPGTATHKYLTAVSSTQQILFYFKSHAILITDSIISTNFSHQHGLFP